MSVKQYQVCFLSHTAVLGGAERSLTDMARSMGGNAKVLLLESGPLESVLTAEGIRVDRISGGGKIKGVRRDAGAMRAIASMAGLVRTAGLVAQVAGDSAVLYANSQKSMIVAAFASRRLGIPMVWHLRDLLTTDHFGRLQLRSAVWFANRYANRVVANSMATAAAFVQSGGKAELVSVIYNGFAEQNGKVGSVQRASRQSYNLNNDPLVGHFSRFAPWKGQHVLIEAMKQLDDTQAILVGTALFGEEKYQSQVQQSAIDLGDRVHFLGFQKEVSSLMQMCDVLVHTSCSPEPFGRVIVEGQMLGKPVIATRGGGVEEIIAHGETGWLVEPNDAEGLAKALSVVLNNPQTSAEVARRGQERARIEFSLERMSKELHRLLNEISGMTD